MAQYVKCLPFKYDGLGLDPQNYTTQIHTRTNSFLSSIYPTKEGLIMTGEQPVGGLKITRQVILPDSGVDFTDINYS